MAQREIGAISKRFGSTPVLDAVSLAVEAGELVSLLGPSGCGKSTLHRIATPPCSLTRHRRGSGARWP